MHEGAIDAPKYEVPVVVLPDKQWLDVNLIDGLLIVDVFLTHHFMLNWFMQGMRFPGVWSP